MGAATDATFELREAQRRNTYEGGCGLCAEAVVVVVVVVAVVVGKVVGTSLAQRRNTSEGAAWLVRSVLLVGWRSRIRTSEGVQVAVCGRGDLS